jgi:hypothetical protein
MAGFHQAPHTVRHRGGHTIVDDIHHATDGTIAIQQRRRAAYHFNAFRQNGFHTVGMIRADRRRVDIADAPLQHLHAIATLAAYDGRTDACAERRTVDAHQLLQSLPKRAGCLLTQRFTTEHIDGQGCFSAGLLQTGSDNDLFDKRIGVLLCSMNTRHGGGRNSGN